MSEASPKAPTSKLATWSLVLGLLGLTCLYPITSIPALIIGIIGIKKIKASHGGLSGDGLALAGAILGGLGLLSLVFVIPLMMSLMGPVVTNVKSQTTEKVSEQRVRIIKSALTLYTNEEGGSLPPDLQTLVDRGFLAQDDLVSPHGDPAEVGYELLVKGRLVDYGDLPQTVAIREKVLSPAGARVVAYLDGAVEKEYPDLLKGPHVESMEALPIMRELKRETNPE